MNSAVTKIVPTDDPARLLGHAGMAATSVLTEIPSDKASCPRLLTVGEVATILRVHPNRVYELASRRTIPAVRVGRLLRFHLGALQAWIESGGTQSEEAPHAAGRAVGRG
jgi:excisionase family DNA binding protein